MIHGVIIVTTRKLAFYSFIVEKTQAKMEAA